MRALRRTTTSVTCTAGEKAQESQKVKAAVVGWDTHLRRAHTSFAKCSTLCFLRLFAALRAPTAAPALLLTPFSLRAKAGLTVLFSHRGMKKNNAGYIFVDDGYPEASDYDSNYIRYNTAVPGSYDQAVATARGETRSPKRQSIFCNCGWPRKIARVARWGAA